MSFSPAATEAGGTPPALGGDPAKLNGYTDGYNIVIGAFGLRQQLDAYEKAGVSSPHPAPETVYLTGGWLDQAHAKLQAARAMPGSGLVYADAAADRFLPALQQASASGRAGLAPTAWREARDLFKI